MCLRQRKRRHKHIKSVSFTSCLLKRRKFQKQPRVRRKRSRFYVGFTLYLAAQVFQNLEKQIKVLSHVFYMPIPNLLTSAAGTRQTAMYETLYSYHLIPFRSASDRGIRLGTETDHHQFGACQCRRLYQWGTDQSENSYHD